MIKTYLNQIANYFHTLRNLKLRQIYYQVYYRVRPVTFGSHPFRSHGTTDVRTLELIDSIEAARSYAGDLKFVFLNRKKSFENDIDWNFNAYGKLWTYNLNYFDFLHQPALPKEEAELLLNSYCEAQAILHDGLESYPISLRGINWIKYFTYHNLSNDRYNFVLVTHYRLLAENLEYHLMGNHLLENACSLLFAGVYFNDEKFYKKARILLKAELQEQVLSDGGHFELSPMYHQIILHRVLDCLNLVKNNRQSDEELSTLLEKTSEVMLGWLRSVTFNNGDLPMVNDSIAGIAATPSDLFSYASRLGISSSKRIRLSASGYRMIKSGQMELFVDAGNIGPDYIPGHAHSDTFNFILYVRECPILVETGTSTYEPGERRLLERKTESHNTVTINGKQQSEVWGNFRVGRRARIVILEEKPNQMNSIHDGFDFMGMRHQRTWRWNDHGLQVVDTIHGAKKDTIAIAHFHFHPTLSVKLDEGIVYADEVIIKANETHKMTLDEYRQAAGYGLTLKGKVLKVFFSRHLEMSFSFAKTDRPTKHQSHE